MIEVYMKLSNYCSLGCTHCYIPINERADSSIMNDDVFKTSLLEIQKMCKSNNTNNVSMLWHGGEPMQLPKSELTKKIIAANLFFMSRGIECRHSMQTSLINFDNEWANIIHQFFSSAIGVSVDPSSRNLNDSYQKYNQVLTKRIKFAQDRDIKIIANF